MEVEVLGLVIRYTDKDKNLGKKFEMLGKWFRYMRERTDYQVKEVTIHPDSNTITVVAEGAIGGNQVYVWDLKKGRIS